jgi:hypothetical protein
MNNQLPLGVEHILSHLTKETYLALSARALKVFLEFENILLNKLSLFTGQWSVNFMEVKLLVKEL